MSIKPLDKTTIRFLNSGQGIVNLECIVKELIENSIDANATSIDLLFVENGLESIQIKDNGSGISESDRSFVAKRYYTSKLTEFDDLENVLTFGFRGEAINSICSISNIVKLTTKTKQDPIGKQYDLDQEGNLSSPKPSNLIPTNGTIIYLTKPFYKLPVRRQLAYKNAAQTMRKLHELIIKYALSYSNIRFSYQTKTVQNQAQSSWIKPITKSIENSISIIYTTQLSNMLESFIETENSITIHLIIPKPNSDPIVIYKEDRIFVYVNQRPINYIQSELKDVIALIKNRYRESIGLSDSNKKNPFIYLDIQLAPNEYDVNVEPNKSTILFHNKQLVYNLVEKVVDQVYPTKIAKFFNSNQVATKQRIISIDPEDEEEPLFMTPNNHHQRQEVEEHQALDSQQNKTYQDNEDELHLYDNDPIESPDTAPSSSERISPSPMPMERSFTFSMASEEEDEDIDHLIETNEFLHQNDLTADKVIETPVKRTLIDHWQIDDTESIPTQVLPNRISHKHDNSVPQDTPSIVTSTRVPVNVPSPILPTLPPRESTKSPTASSPVIPRRSLNTTSDVLEMNTPAPPTMLPIIQNKRSLERTETTQPVVKKSRTVNLSTPSFRNLQDTHPKQLCRTLNQTQTISCSLDEMKSNYEKRKTYSDDKFRTRIEDCLFTSKGGRITNLMQVPKLNKYGVSLYTRGTSDAKVNEIGLVKLKMLHVNKIFKELLIDHKLLCKSLLPRPVQIQFDIEDSLCPILLALDSKEVYIKDDLHGNQSVTFSDITDDRILSNGFKARWRKDSYSSHIVVQLTGIYSLGSGYGPSDFRELLGHLNERPRKVKDYLWTLAHEMSKTQYEDTLEQVTQELDRIKWEKETEWEFSYSDTTNQTFIACKKT